MHDTQRILICSCPVAGHVNPALPIARALVARGHDVRWYAAREFAGAINRTGATHLPFVEAFEPGGRSLDDLFPERVGLSDLAGLKFDLRHLFLDTVPAQVRDVRRILADFPADAMLVDTAFVAAGMVHELGGPPYATYGISVLPIASRDIAPPGLGRMPSTNAAGKLRDRVLGRLLPKLLFRDVQRHHNAIRRQLALRPTGTTILEAMVSPYLFLQAATPAFEYPRRDLPPQVHFIGPLLPDVGGDAARPSWWERITAATGVVLVNQGTIATDLDDLVAPALSGLAGEDVVVVATGGSGASGLTAPVPANAIVEPFVPFGALLPHVDVMITNGGFGGVQFALANGVPLVVAGITEDKPEIAARIEWSGTGINLRAKSPTPEQVLDAVRRVRADPSYRRNAQRVRDDYATHDAPREAVRLLERLARTGRAVHRGTTDFASGSERSGEIRRRRSRICCEPHRVSCTAVAGTLCITGRAEWDGLLNTDGTALLIGMLLDQQVPMEWAFAGPWTLRNRLGHLDAVRIAALDVDAFVAVCCDKPAIHRFPAAMGRRIHELCNQLVDRFDGLGATVWHDVATGAELYARLRALSGYGEEKAQIFVAILGKRMGVQPDGWREAAGKFGDDTPRSVADITDVATLATVREWKKAAKAAKRDKQDRPLV